MSNGKIAYILKLNKFFFVSSAKKRTKINKSFIFSHFLTQTSIVKGFSFVHSAITWKNTRNTEGDSFILLSPLRATLNINFSCQGALRPLSCLLMSSGFLD